MQARKREIIFVVLFGDKAFVIMHNLASPDFSSHKKRVEAAHIELSMSLWVLSIYDFM